MMAIRQIFNHQYAVDMRSQDALPLVINTVVIDDKPSGPLAG